MDKPTAFIFFGRSGSGKGTQSEMLAAYLKEKTGNDVPLLSLGRHLRAFTEGGDTYTKKLAQETIERGELLPAFVSIRTWAQWFNEQLDGAHHVIIDGVARHHLEAPILIEALTFYGLMPAHAIFLDVSPEVARRWLHGRARSDDTDEAIAKRFAWFDEEVSVSLEHFKNTEHTHFHPINGEQDKEAVHADIIKALAL